MSDSNAVKPCPQCNGGNCDVALYAEDGDVKAAVHYCHDCGYARAYDTVEKAIRAWLRIEDGKVIGVGQDDQLVMEGVSSERSLQRDFRLQQGDDAACADADR